MTEWKQFFLVAPSVQLNNQTHKHAQQNNKKRKKSLWLCHSTASAYATNQMRFFSFYNVLLSGTWLPRRFWGGQECVLHLGCPLRPSHLGGQACSLYTVKNGLQFSRPQPGWHWPNLISGRKSLVSDIPAGDGKIVNLVLQCTQYFFKKALVISFRLNNEMFTSFAKIKPD